MGISRANFGALEPKTHTRTRARSTRYSMANTNRRNDMNPVSVPTAAPAPEERYERYENSLLQRMNTMPSVGGFKSEHHSISVGSLSTPSSRKPLVAKGRPSSSPSSESDSHGHRKKRGGGRITTVAATVLFVLGVVLLVETMVVVAYVAAPLVRKLSPSDDEAFRTQSTANDTAFVDWCQQAECMGSDASQVMCEQLNQAMLTSTHADGSPVLPLPKPFCTALETLSTKKCLCDPDLAKASQDT